MNTKLKLSFLLTLATISISPAGINYIDAELTNTTINGQSPVNSVNYSTNFTELDGLWGWRTNRTDVNGAGIWVTDGGTGSISDLESTQPLKVNITLPQSGNYKLYALIMNNNSGTGHWDIASRIGDTGQFTSYNKYAPETTRALASDFNGTVKIANGNDMSFKVMIGEYTALSANETVSIYINGLDGWDGQTGLDQRTRFDGLGYEKVAPLSLLASNPSPGDNADYILTNDTLLKWDAAQGSLQHNVYLGTDPDRVKFANDLDGNRNVDLGDIARLADKWLKHITGTSIQSLDLDNSGIIDIGDLSLLATQWLTSDNSSFLGSFDLQNNQCSTAPLYPDRNYYWRVDEEHSDQTYKGNTWHFKTFKADGLTARIYDDIYLSELKATRIDPQINFNWGQAAPAPLVGPETFSIEWTGAIAVPQSGEYSFYVSTDDGVRLYINNILIIDNWTDQSIAEKSDNLFLRSGYVYPIRMEYYDNTGSAVATLSWSGPGINKQIIPTGYLASTMPELRPKDIWVVDLNSQPVSMRFLTLTLQGLVAKDEPAILTKQGGLTTLIRTTMEQEGTVFHDNASAWTLLNKFRDKIEGLIVCGSDLESVNAATSLCGPMNAIGVYETILAEVQSRTGLPVLADVRGLNELAIYNNYQNLFNNELMVDVNKIDFLRDISITRNAFTYYNVDSATRIQFIDGLTSQGMVMGWGSNAEYGWVKDVSKANASGVPSDWSKNLSTLSRLQTNIPKPPRKYPEPVKEGERIVAFSMSDGDNLQVMAGDFITNTKFFGHPARGTFPISWEFPPSMGEFIPRGVRCYYEAANYGNNADCFIAGPSGAGYAFHHYMTGQATFAKNTGQAMKKCGLTVATLINENNADITEVDEFLDRPEIMGIAYKDWAPYNRRNGAIYWHNGKPCVSYKFLLWAGDVDDPSGLGDWKTVSAGIAAMPSSPATNQGSYAIINSNAWSFGAVGGPVQAIVNTIELLPPNTRVVTVEELIILLRNNFGTPVSQQEYYDM